MLIFTFLDFLVGALVGLTGMGGGEEREKWEWLEDVPMKITIEKTASEEMRDILLEQYQAELKDRKGFRRFSTSKMAFWDKLSERVMEILRDKRIKALENEVKALAEMNKDLVEMVRKLEKENTEYKTLTKELSRMLVRIMDITDRLLGISGHPKEEDEEYKAISNEFRKLLAKLDSMTAGRKYGTKTFKLSQDKFSNSQQ